MRASEFLIEYKLKVTKSSDGVAVKATADGKPLGHAEFFYDEEGRLDPQTVWVDERYQRQGIARDMYDHLKSLGYTIIRSWDQTDAGKGFWDKHRGPDARVWEQEQTPAEKFIADIYDEYPQTFQNNHVMPFGSEEFAMFKLKPSTSRRGAVEVYWFQAYPLRTGVGSRAMKILQDRAREHGVALTLMPWDKGQVSQAALSKFYRRQGFKPITKGGRSMSWEPLDELAPSPDRDDNDDVPDPVFVLANRWWNATDKQPQIESVLNSMGWSIHQVESEDDAVQLQHRDGTTYFISADDFDPDVFENFADGKVKGKSRPGRVKRAGASCKGSVTDLRARAKKYGGERGKMYHWCANMKSGRQKNK